MADTSFVISYHTHQYPHIVKEAGRRHLRSFDVYTCVVPRTQSQIGDRSFSVCSCIVAMEQPTDREPEERHYLRILQMIT